MCVGGQRHVSSCHRIPPCNEEPQRKKVRHQNGLGKKCRRVDPHHPHHYLLCLPTPAYVSLILKPVSLGGGKPWTTYTAVGDTMWTNSRVPCLEGLFCFKSQNKKKHRTVSAWLDGRTAEGLEPYSSKHACATLVQGS